MVGPTKTKTEWTIFIYRDKDSEGFCRGGWKTKKQAVRALNEWKAKNRFNLDTAYRVEVKKRTYKYCSVYL